MAVLCEWSQTHCRNCAGDRTPRDSTFILNARAAVCTSFSEMTSKVLAGFQKNRHAGELGNHLLQQLEPLSSKSGAMLVNPVTFPPGRARLSTRPVPTGSPTAIMTMGIVLVAS